MTQEIKDKIAEDLKWRIALKKQEIELIEDDKSALRNVPDKKLSPVYRNHIIRALNVYKQVVIDELCEDHNALHRLNDIEVTA